MKAPLSNTEKRRCMAVQEFMTQGSLKLKILEQMISLDEVCAPQCQPSPYL